MLIVFCCFFAPIFQHESNLPPSGSLGGHVCYSNFSRLAGKGVLFSFLIVFGSGLMFETIIRKNKHNSATLEPITSRKMMEMLCGHTKTPFCGFSARLGL